MSDTPRQRLAALDVFRGLTVAGMLLVNDPGTWAAIYPPLEHAEWFGWTPTDLIFPFFLFIVGITTHLSFSARRARGADDRELTKQILRRGGLILLVGLLMTGFPYHQFYLTLPGGWVFDSRTPHLDVAHWRLTGVLQRIALCYTLGALLTLRTTVKQQVVILATLLLGYWFAMTLIPVPGYGIGALMLGVPDGSLAAWLDRAILTPDHMWVGSHTWDPEGLLSTVPAIGTVILGDLTGRWIASDRPIAEKLNAMFTAGALGMMTGLMWHWSFPIAKNILDEQLRDLHRGHGRRIDRGVHVAHRRAQDHVVDQAVDHLWDQPALRLRRERIPGAFAVYVDQSPHGRRPRPTRDRDLQRRLRDLARAQGCESRLRDLLGDAVHGIADDPVSQEHHHKTVMRCRC